MMRGVFHNSGLEKIRWMKPSPKPSFEIFHLISSLLVRLNVLYETCDLVEQQIYVLAYLDSYGKKASFAEKVLLRTTITDVLKKVFKCNANQVSNWVNGLVSNGLLGEKTLKKDQTSQLFSVKKGTRNKVVFLEKEGNKKLSFFIGQLLKFRTELTKPNSVLLPPGADEFGTVAKLVFVLLAGFERS